MNHYILFLKTFFAGALLLTMLNACNRNGHDSDDNDGKATTTGYIESTGTTGATDYDNDSTNRGSNHHSDYNSGMSDSSGSQRP